MLTELNFWHDDTHIQIPLHYAVTEICGESGTGKSFIFNALCNKGKELDFKLCTIDYSNFHSCTSLLDPDTLYVIDEIDAMLLYYPDFIDKINSWQYQFLLFGHNFSGIKCDLRFAYNLVKQKNLLTVRPLIPSDLYAIDGTFKTDT